MAARKSCTHLTWAEAKSNSKVGGSSSSKKPLVPKKIDHGKALTAKVIAKNGASRDDISKEKTLMKRAKRGEERAAAAALKRAEEKERQRREMMVKPFDVARDRVIAIADELQKNCIDVRKEEDGSGKNGRQQQIIGKEDQQMVAECREMQVNELLGLDAIYNTDDGEDANKEMRIANSADFESLQQRVEQWQIDPENEALLENVANHPHLSFTIQITVDGTIRDDHFADKGEVELTSIMLLRVTLPPLYPLGEISGAANNTLPTFDVEFFCCTEREMECTPDKPLESLAHLDESGLKESLAEEAMQIFPDPCVYMVVTACLMERLFEFTKLSVRGKQILDNYFSQKSHPA